MAIDGPEWWRCGGAVSLGLITEGQSCIVCHYSPGGEDVAFHSGVQFVTALVRPRANRNQRHLTLVLAMQFANINHGNLFTRRCRANYRHIKFEWWLCTWGVNDNPSSVNDGTGWRPSGNDSDTISTNEGELQNNPNIWFKARVVYWACEANDKYGAKGKWRKRTSTDAITRYWQNFDDDGYGTGWRETTEDVIRSGRSE